MSGFQYFKLGVGGLAALCGVLIFVMRVRTIVSGRVTQGVIVGEKVETHAGTRNEMRSVSHAIFEFEHEGKIYRCQSSFGAPRGTEAGTAVRVRYLPSDPQSSGEIDSPMAIWFFPIGTMAFGAVFIAIGLFVK
ncbi:MAG: DUF3592 domain-containing protein [Burkholderiales bacterium]